MTDLLSTTATAPYDAVAEAFRASSKEDGLLKQLATRRALVRSTAVAPDAAIAELHDFITHRHAWRNALVLAKQAAEDRFEDTSYWTHEITAFDRAFDAIDPIARATIAAVETVSRAVKETAAAQAEAHRVALAAAYENQLRPLDPGYPENGQVADLESACIAYLEAFISSLAAPAVASESTMPPHPVLLLAATPCRSAAAYFKRTEGYYEHDDAVRSFEATSREIISLVNSPNGRSLQEEHGHREAVRAFAAAAEVCLAKAEISRSKQGEFSRKQMVKAYDEMAVSIERLPFPTIVGDA